MTVADLRGLFAEMVAAGVVEIDLGAGEGRLRVVRRPGGDSASAPTREPTREAGGRVITAPLAGRVVGILVGPGSALRPGRPLCVIEAAGVTSEIEAAVEGRVVAVLVEVGQAVEAGAPIVRITALRPSRSAPVSPDG